MIERQLSKEKINNCERYFNCLIQHEIEHRRKYDLRYKYNVSDQKEYEVEMRKEETRNVQANPR